MMVLGLLGSDPARGESPYFPATLACEAALFTPIPYTPSQPDEIFPTDIRDLPGGHYYSPDEPLPDLPTDRYLYQILVNGGVYLISELDVVRYVQEGRGVWKHEVFGLDHRERFKESIEGKVIASGWIIRTFGVVVFISNGSGSRRGGPERVNLARRVFEARTWTIDPYADFERLGAEVEELSRAISIAGGNAASRGRRHSKEAMQKDVCSLEIMADVYTHPDGLELIELYEELGRTLIPYVRSKSSAGLPAFFCRPGVAGGLTHLAPYFAYPLTQARGADGMHHGILRIWDNITRHQYKPMDYVNIIGPIFVQAAINTLRPQLTAKDLARLERVRDGFAALPDWKTPPPDTLFYKPIGAEP